MHFFSKFFRGTSRIQVRSTIDDILLWPACCGDAACLCTNVSDLDSAICDCAMVRDTTARATMGVSVTGIQVCVKLLLSSGGRRAACIGA